MEFVNSVVTPFKFLLIPSLSFHPVFLSFYEPAQSVAGFLQPPVQRWGSISTERLGLWVPPEPYILDLPFSPASPGWFLWADLLSSCWISTTSWSIVGRLLVADLKRDLASSTSAWTWCLQLPLVVESLLDTHHFILSRWFFVTICSDFKEVMFSCIMVKKHSRKLSISFNSKVTLTIWSFKILAPPLNIFIGSILILSVTGPWRELSVPGEEAK